MEDFFKSNRQEFDFSEPNAGHFNRFEAKLRKDSGSGKIGGTPWYIFAVAASILLFFGYWMGNHTIHTEEQGIELADVSPKMQETQNFYMTTIQKEMAEIRTKQTPANQKIIDDAFQQLELLETNYGKLTLELKESNADKRVIYAMINNFQSRLQVLQNLMDQLEEFEELVPQENRV
jgi:septal ring factor EnvC (AmiA/AmiB activator)